MALEDLILNRIDGIQGNCVPHSFDKQPIQLPKSFTYINYSSANFTFNNGRKITDGLPDLIIIDNLSQLKNAKILPHTKIYAILKDKDVKNILREASSYRCYWSDIFQQEDYTHLILFQSRKIDSPIWNGSSGKTIFVYSQWGFGDIIRNLRFLDKLSYLFEEVIFEARFGIEELAALYPATILSKGCPVPPHDYHVKLENVCNFIEPFFKSIEINNCNIYDDFTIGVTATGSKLTLNPQRDFDGSFLKDVEANFLNFSDKTFDFMTNLKLNNWLTTARYLQNVDLLISADTAVAHLGGILGVKTYVLLSRNLYNTSLLDETSLWYPTMTLIKSQKDDWSDAYSQVYDIISNLKGQSLRFL